MTGSKLFIFSVVVVSIIAAVVFANHRFGASGFVGHSMGRHMQGTMRDVPTPYHGMKNPLLATSEVVTKGALLYKANCGACHGSYGRGDGPAGEKLSPRPADLAHIVQMPMTRDDYLFWVISEGGKRFDTAMPAFRDVLDEKARWQIIHYLRKL